MVCTFKKNLSSIKPEGQRDNRVLFMSNNKILVGLKSPVAWSPGPEPRDLHPHRQIGLDPVCQTSLHTKINQPVVTEQNV